MKAIGGPFDGVDLALGETPGQDDANIPAGSVIELHLDPATKKLARIGLVVPKQGSSNQATTPRSVPGVVLRYRVNDDRELRYVEPA